MTMISQTKQLVDTIRQHTAGSGADLMTLRTMLDYSRTRVDAIAALDRLERHIDSIDQACTQTVVRADHEIALTEMALSAARRVIAATHANGYGHSNPHDQCTAPVCKALRLALDARHELSKRTS